MYKLKYIITTAMFCGLLGACSAPDVKTPDDPTVNHSTGTLAPIEFTGGENTTVFAFRQQVGGFLLQGIFDTGWTRIVDGTNGPRYRLVAELPLGNYKFLYAASWGTNLLVLPDPMDGSVDFDQISFNLQQLPTEGSYYSSADEIFMQSSSEDRQKVFNIRGPQKISATLDRKVARVDVNVNRGYRDDVTGEFTAVPYDTAAGQTVKNFISGIEITVEGAGERLSLSGVDGIVDIYDALATTSAVIDPETGFAAFSGPYILPIEADSRVTVELITVDGNGFPQTLSKTLENVRLEANRQLIVTLWMSGAYPFINLDITATTEPITAPTDGDSGIWD